MELAGALEDIDLEGYFVYHGREGEIVPEDVIRVWVHPSVKVIKKGAFYERMRLTTVILNYGLEEIGEEAFYMCTSLQHIDVPPTVKSIKDYAFRECSMLTTVTLHDGLEEICEEAFRDCTSLELIGIPPTIKAIHDSAFKGCSQLNRVVFRNEIEVFATCDAMRGWWDQVLHENRVHEATLKTYHFLFRCSIPERLGAVPIPLQANVYEMLRCIPTKSVGNLNAHLDTIDSRLTSYEYLIEEIFPFLELAIWKSTSSRRSLEEDDVILNIFSMV